MPNETNPPTREKPKLSLTALGGLPKIKVRKYGSTEVRKYGSTEVRKYGSTEVRKYGSTNLILFFHDSSPFI